MIVTHHLRDVLQLESVKAMLFVRQFLINAYRRNKKLLFQFLAKIASQRLRSAKISSASLTKTAAAGTVTFRSL